MAIPPGKSPLQEFSVIYTERATNMMSMPFRTAMQTTLLPILREAYNAEAAVIVPGSGTFAMEAVARQFALHQPSIILRNGLFSFRWSAILEMALSSVPPTVLRAVPVDVADPLTAWMPHPIDQVVAAIKSQRPKVVFAPHVETSTGVILPDEYIIKVGEACRTVDALFVLDCVASGAIWADMKRLVVDVIISAPQKAWSSPACCGFVMLSERGRAMLKASGPSTSFALDLKQWDVVWSEKYAKGEFLYHTTVPTDSLLEASRNMAEAKEFGFQKAREAQIELGRRVRAMLQAKGFKSVAAPGYEAPGVVVVHAPRPDLVPQFIKSGIQIAAGVPFKLDEPPTTSTIRFGLFGLDKWKDVDGTVARLKTGVDASL